MVARRSGPRTPEKCASVGVFACWAGLLQPFSDVDAPTSCPKGLGERNRQPMTPIRLGATGTPPSSRGPVIARLLPVLKSWRAKAVGARNSDLSHFLEKERKRRLLFDALDGAAPAANINNHHHHHQHWPERHRQQAPTRDS